MFDSVVKMLSDGINNCVSWFFTVLDSIQGDKAWNLIFAFIVAGFLTSLILPFIGYRVRAGESDKARISKTSNNKKGG